MNLATRCRTSLRPWRRVRIRGRPRQRCYHGFWPTVLRSFPGSGAARLLAVFHGLRQTLTLPAMVPAAVAVGLVLACTWPRL